MADRDPETFAEVKTRLDEIVEAVSDDNLSLDDALSLYEEAVALGLRASDLLEKDIEPDDAESASVEALDSVQNSKEPDDVAEKASVEAFDSVQSSKESNSVEAASAGNPSATQNINAAAGAAAGSVA